MNFEFRNRKNKSIADLGITTRLFSYFIKKTTIKVNCCITKKVITFSKFYLIKEMNTNKKYISSPYSG